MKLNLKTCGFALGALTLLLGRYPISWLLSSGGAKKLGPRNNQKDHGTHVESPTGNVLFVKTEGPLNGWPLVFIHGLNSNSRQWQFQQQRFSTNYRLISIDLPGHGRSAEAVDLSINALAIDLSTVLTKLNIQQPVLHGHSLGGMMILEYCKLKLSPTPSAIVLQSCSYTNPLKTMPISPLPQLLQGPMIAPALQHIVRHSKLFTTLGYAAYSSGLSAVFYRAVLFSGKQSGSTLRTMAAFAAKTRAKTTAQALLGTFVFNATDELKNIDIPCLIIASKNDRLIDPTTALHMQQKIQGSELVMVNGGHQSLAEFPRETNDALEKFLHKHGI